MPNSFYFHYFLPPRAEKRLWSASDNLVVFGCKNLMRQLQSGIKKIEMVIFYLKFCEIMGLYSSSK